MNLNNFKIDTDEGEGMSFQDYSVFEANKPVSVYFRNLEAHLTNHIRKADVIVGCVAWLTHEGILGELAKKDHVSIIVQKEDFLRPDLGTNNNKQWGQKLRGMYGKLKNDLTRYELDNILSRMSVNGDPSIEAIRCVGNYNYEKKPAFPRMHNKFLVFCKITGEHEGIEGMKVIKPYGVWTGSFNLTKNAVASLENAIYITDHEVVSAYFYEYGQIAAISEPLDWEEKWIAPEWRIGT